MSSSIIRNSQFENGYAKLNEVTIILDNAEDIATVGKDYSPGSFAYTADLRGCWQLNNEHIWIPIASAGTSEAFGVTNDGKGNVVVAAFSSYIAVDDGKGNIELKEGE